MSYASLGEAYSKGFGVTKDERRALEWWQKGASSGDNLSLFWFVISYEEGRGVPKNYVQAQLWLSIASSSPQAESFREKLSSLEKKMTSEQIAEAQKLSVTYAELIKQGKPLPTQ